MFPENRMTPLYAPILNTPSPPGSTLPVSGNVPQGFVAPPDKTKPLTWRSRTDSKSQAPCGPTVADHAPSKEDFLRTSLANVTVKVCQCSYFSAGNLRGWQCGLRSAPLALSAAAAKF